MNDASVPITVYYVVGLPRTGSTFVGDWIARHLNALNAGEVWQTFRSLGLVHEPGFDGSQGRWAQPDTRAKKNVEIKAHPFWSKVLARSCDDPYAALIAEAGRHSRALVDCSKDDRGVKRYEELGCSVEIVHTLCGHFRLGRVQCKNIKLVTVCRSFLG